jgi:hypothetical protein
MPPPCMLLPMLLQKPVYILHLFGSTHWKWELRSKKKGGHGCCQFHYIFSCDHKCTLRFQLQLEVSFTAHDYQHIELQMIE